MKSVDKKISCMITPKKVVIMGKPSYYIMLVIGTGMHVNKWEELVMNINLLKIDDKNLERITGGTWNEAVEIINWCNRHGADLPVPEWNDPNAAEVMEEAYFYLFDKCAENGVNLDSCIQDDVRPTAYKVNETWMNHEQFMAYLNSRI